MFAADIVDAIREVVRVGVTTLTAENSSNRIAIDSVPSGPPDKEIRCLLAIDKKRRSQVETESCFVDQICFWAVPPGTRHSFGSFVVRLKRYQRVRRILIRPVQNVPIPQKRSCKTMLAGREVVTLYGDVVSGAVIAAE